MTEVTKTNEALPRWGPLARWGRIAADWWQELNRDHVSVMAAGVGFYAFLSIFPAMSAVISIYGLLGDPHVIERQLGGLAGVLPQAAVQLLSTQLQGLIAAPQSALGIGFIVSLGITVWSAMYGTATLMQALTVAYNDRERRSVLAFYAQAAGLTIGIGVFAISSLLMITVVPACIDKLPFPPSWDNGVAMVRWPILAGLVYVALAVVYRVAPSRQVPQWHWLAPGTIAAALLWLLGSAGFSYYVARFSSYNKTYGTLGAVVVLMMWFYLSAYIVLAGAELNAEHQKAQRPER
jgi:membrane protein